MNVRIVALTLSMTMAGWTGTSAGAQYFGRNKVQYEAFDFQILQTPHFDIYYYPEEQEATTYAARLAEQWYARLSRALDHEFKERQPIVLYASHSHFAQTTVISGQIDEGVGGVTEHLKGRVVLPFAAGLGETSHVLGHELVHAFQRDILRQRNRPMAALPLWFLEGMAEYLAVGGMDANTAMWLRDAAAERRLPSISELSDPRWFPYRYGQALWTYLAERFGEDVVARALKSMASGGAIGRLIAVTGVDPGTLSEEWHEAVVREVGMPARNAIVTTSKVITPKGSGRLNVAPALSPNGKEIVFLSERDQYSIDVYLADASNGALKRRLVQTAADPHFDSLQFISSAGAWDPAGRRFVLAAVHEGRPVLTILEVETGSVEREIVLDELDEVFNPSWSPDGTRLAFSALRNGLSDLYVLDIESSRLEPLTSDPFADLQPSWSPDGKSIAFATDRFSSSLGSWGDAGSLAVTGPLTFGKHRLAIFDLASRHIRELPGLPGAKNIDPKWAADGKSVYFVSDRDDHSNVYRVDVGSRDVYQVTSVESGVSGITANSPALSVAQDAGRLAFSVYRHGGYELHVQPAEKGTLVAPFRPEEIAGRADASPVASNVTPPTFGPVDSEEFAVRPYNRGLTFDGVGQPYLSAGGGSLGSFVRAGISFGFGDMLGQQSLQTAVQFGKGVDDFAIRTAYLNRRSRWNWGIVAGQLPSTLSASRTTTVRSSPGVDGTITSEDVVFRQIHRQVNGTVIYPFSRARRLELTAGLHSVTYDRRSTTTVYRAGTTELLSESRDTTGAGSVMLFESGIALVHDSALVGPTSPVLGSRFRFEVAPTLGGVSALTVLSDYRRYFMPRRPLTLALRVKHLGRFGDGAGDTRLLPLTYSLRDTVRGYDAKAFAARICGADSTPDCAAQRHFSTRQLFAGNVELRFPVWGVFRGKAEYGPLPLEGFAFSDTGWIWSVPLVGERKPERLLLSNVGAGVRLNASGFVFEFAAGRPVNDNQVSGWRFVVNFRPGF